MGSRSTRSGTRKPPRTGGSPGRWSASTASASRSTAASRRCRRSSRAFPVSAFANPELAAFLAYGEVIRPSLDTAAAYIALAERHASEVPPERRRVFGAMLATARLTLARWRGDYGTLVRRSVPAARARRLRVRGRRGGRERRPSRRAHDPRHRRAVVRCRRRRRAAPRGGAGAGPPERAALRGAGLSRPSRRGSRDALRWKRHACSQRRPSRSWSGSDGWPSRSRRWCWRRWPPPTPGRAGSTMRSRGWNEPSTRSDRTPSRRRRCSCGTHAGPSVWVRASSRRHSPSSSRRTGCTP